MLGGQHLARYRAAINNLLQLLNMPKTFTVDELIQAVANYRGRKIELHPDPSMRFPYTGKTYITPTKYIILYPANEDIEQATLSICHELAHIIQNHKGKPIDNIEMPYVDGWLCFARSTYDDPDELEAELFASLLVGKITSNNPLIMSITES